MPILAYDHTELVEPNLLVPGGAPIGPVKINNSHALAPSNFWDLRSISKRDLVTGILLTLTGAVSTEAGNVKFSESQQSNLLATHLISSSSTPFDFSLQIKFYIEHAGTSTAIMQWGNKVRDDIPYLMVYLTSAGYLRILFDGSYIYTGTTDLRNKWITLSFSGRSDQYVYVHVDGIEVYGADKGSSWSGSHPDNKFWINNSYNRNTGTNYKAIFKHLTYWTGKNSILLSMIPKLARDPYPFIIPAG